MDFAAAPVEHASAPPRAVRPDYDGAWIGAIVPALRAARPPEWLPEAAATARSTVLFVIDGLGWHILERHRASLPTLAALDGGPITSAAPSTTATGLTSITTGAVPADHGLLGYRMFVGDSSLNVLRWRIDGGGTVPAPSRVQPLPAFDGDDVPVVAQAAHRDSGFTRAHLRGGAMRLWETAAVIVPEVAALIAAGQRFVYAYYDGVDKVAHGRGTDGDGTDAAAFQAELRATDLLVADLLEVTPSDSAVVVTADHGHVDVGPSGMHPLGTDVSRLVQAQSGESRFRMLRARQGAAADLHAAALECFGDVAWVFTRDELFDGGWLGGRGTAEVRRRVGDVVLAPHALMGFIDPTYPNEAAMASRHGSLTAEEVLVPLLAGFGGA